MRLDCRALSLGVWLGESRKVKLLEYIKENKKLFLDFFF